MEKTMPAFEARRLFGKILDDVAAKNTTVVVERHGQPVAAVVPLWVYQNWKREREAFFERMDAAARRSNLSPEEAEALAEEAVRAVRATHPL